MKITPNSEVIYNNLRLGYENLFNKNAKGAIHHFSHALYEGKKNPDLTKFIDKTIKKETSIYRSIKKPKTIINLGILKITVSTRHFPFLSDTLNEIERSKRLNLLIKAFEKAEKNNLQNSQYI